MADEDGMLDRLVRRARAASARAREVQAHSLALKAQWDQEGARLPRRCAWCGRIEIGGRWREPDELPEFFKARRTPDAVSNGICERCFDELRATGRSR